MDADDNRCKVITIPHMDLWSSGVKNTISVTGDKLL
jgi:hypothetical protein